MLAANLPSLVSTTLNDRAKNPTIIVSTSLNFEEHYR